MNADAIAFLTQFNTSAEIEMNLQVTASWVYYTNVTEANANASAMADARLSQFMIEQAQNASIYQLDQIK
jgi:uncharacterized protein YbaA (DUF1428 family)